MEVKVIVYQSWKPEVVADSSGAWTGNGLRFPTKGEAEANVDNLFCRWTLVSKTRVVPSIDPPNYNWVDGKLVGIPEVKS